MKKKHNTGKGIYHLRKETQGVKTTLKNLIKKIEDIEKLYEQLETKKVKKVEKIEKKKETDQRYLNIVREYTDQIGKRIIGTTETHTEITIAKLIQGRVKVLLGGKERSLYDIQEDIKKIIQEEKKQNE